MKALVVEDDMNILEMIAQKLKSEKFIVDKSMNGDEALMMAKNGKYDIIILDLELPGKKGLEIIHQLRVVGNKTPILIASSHTLVEDRVKGLEAGADDYLIKNFSLDELMARVKVLLRRQIQSRRNFLKFRDVTINLSDMSVSRMGRKVDLSKKEFIILTELIKHKNAVLSRKDIMQSAWGDKYTDVASNTIDVHMKSLRSKIEKSFTEAAPFIETIRGYGYIVRDK